MTRNITFNSTTKYTYIEVLATNFNSTSIFIVYLVKRLIALKQFKLYFYILW